MTTFITRASFPTLPSEGRLRVAVKDLIDVAGSPTTNGSTVVAPTAASDGPVDTDATCMRGTRAAESAGNAWIVGKANMHELAFGISGINPWYGTPVNPLDPAVVPGGSSSGSAVAVGAGRADVAFGSDTGGSIRIPAACCGVVGLKTTWGRIPLEGVRPLAPSLDTVGPMAATVALTAEAMKLLEPGFEAASAPGRRIGRARLPCSPTIDRALDNALAGARLYGMTLSEVELPGWAAAQDAAMIVLMAEAWQVHSTLWSEYRDRLSADVAERLETASHITDEEVLRAREEAGVWSDALDRLFESIDILALPTLADHPPRLERSRDMASIRLTAPFNLSGHPALSLPIETTGPTETRGPVHTAGRGMIPASLQLVGPRGSEEDLLAIAAVIEGVAAPN